MRYTIEKHERYVVIEPLVPFLDTDAATKLKGEFLMRNTTGQRNIVLDLYHVEGMIDGGIRLGLLADRLCKNLGGLFILLNLQPEIENAVKVAKLDEYFIIVKELEEAADLIFESELILDLQKK